MYLKMVFLTADNVTETIPNMVNFKKIKNLHV